MVPASEPSVSAPRRINYSAPVACYDWPVQPGEKVAACFECLPWYVEVVMVDGQPFVREWHAVDCPVMDD